MQWNAKIRNSVLKNITYTYFGVKLSGTVGRVGNVLSFMPKVLGSNPAWPSCIFCILLHILSYFAGLKFSLYASTNHYEYIPSVQSKLICAMVQWWEAVSLLVGIPHRPWIKSQFVSIGGVPVVLWFKFVAEFPCSFSHIWADRTKSSYMGWVGKGILVFWRLKI